MRRSFLFFALTCIPLLASAQFHRAWVRTWGGPDKYGLGRGVAVDDSGNVYVAGETTVSGSFVGVVVKYSAGGEFLWHRYVSGTPHAIKADNNGVYFTGTIYYSGISNMVTYKLLTNGDNAWSDWYPCASGAGASDLAMDGSGNVYVSGWGRAGDSAKSYRMATIKYSSLGAREWVRLDSVRAYIERVAVAVNETGVYVCAPDHGVTYLASYDLDGNPRWFKRHGRFGAYWSGYHGDIALDKKGDVYFTSCVARDTLGPVELLVAAYTGDGAFRWENSWSSSASGMATGRAMALDDSTGSIFVTGLYYPDRTVNVKRAVLIKYTVLGNQPWVRTYLGEADWDSFDDVAADHHGNAYVAGFTDVGWVIGSKNLLMKYGPEGDVKWSDSYTLTGGDDVWSNVVVDTAHNIYVGGNITTTKNPYTTVLATGKYTQRGLFKPGRDGWQFANTTANMWPQTWWSQFHYDQPPYPALFTKWPISAKSSDFPDWPLFVEAFGQDQCYFPFTTPGTSVIYRPSAILGWRSIAKNWRGSCFGFALSSLLIFNAHLRFEDLFPGNTTLFQVPLSDTWRKLVNRYFLHQFGKTRSPYVASGWSKPPVLTARDMITMISTNSWNTMSLRIFNNNGPGGHEVVPCSVKTSSLDPDVIEVTTYDSNYPGEEGLLSIDTVLNTWSYDKLPEFGEGSKWLYLAPDLGSLASRPDLPKIGTVPTPSGPTLGADSARLILYVTPDAGCMITDESGGALGYDPKDSTLTTTMTDAFPVIPIAGGFSPPIGYNLPVNRYEVQTFSPPDTSLYIRATGTSIIAAYEEHGIQPGEKTLLRLSITGDTLLVKNPENRARNGMLRSLRFSPEREMACDVTDLIVPPNDSMAIVPDGETFIRLDAGGSPTTYTVSLTLAAPETELSFLHRGIAMSPGSSHTIAPDWDLLDSQPVLVYVDSNRDGVPEDTLTLTNEFTGVITPGEGGKVPSRFVLEQNFPNPFNPVTTIRYGLPQKSGVRLTVYNLLGQEVTTLVNEEQNAGYHEVTFDASGLASGVYIYRLTAGSFAQSRKLLLVR